MTKKIPLRMCVGCTQMFPKKELIRIVHDKEGNLTVDLKGKAPGRGAYLCKNPNCLKKARKAKRLEKAFECEIPDEIYERLTKELSDEQ